MSVVKTTPRETPGSSGYFFKKLDEQSSDTVTLQDLKPLINEILQALREVKDCGTPDVADAVDTLNFIPQCIMHLDLEADLDKIDPAQYNEVLRNVGQYLLEQGFSKIAALHYKLLYQALSHTSAKSAYGAKCQYNSYLWCEFMHRHLEDASFSRSIFEEGILEDMLRMFEYFVIPTNEIPEVSTIHGNGANRRHILLSLYNGIRACPDLRTTYRRANVVNILLRLLSYKGNFQMKLITLLTLSYVVDESQRDMLRTSENSIKFLTTLLKTAVQSKHHYVADSDKSRRPSLIFSATELLDGLNHLAVNDANKLDILQHGGLPVITRMLEPDFSEDEQKLAAEVIWNLAFVDEIKTTSEVQNTKATIKNLLKSLQKSVRDAGSYAVWEISDNRERSTSSQPTDSPLSYEETLKRDSETSHLMLSYQWDSQETVLAIRERLKKAGYKIWMDVDDMSGDTLEAMAKAVESSSVVIICITEKYKESQNCRSEASYAFKLKKPIIPLLLEAGYSPDGWLGLILGTKLYFEFFSDDEMTSNMQKLIKEIEKRGLQRRQNDEADGAAGVVPEQAATQQTSPTRSPSKKPVSGTWSVEGVQSWLKETDLAEL